MSAAVAGVLTPAEVLEREWRARHNRWVVAMTVTLATFMEILDTSIANVSLPHIAGGLSTGYDESTWILTSYLVSNAIVLPISGWCSNRIGRKRFYMACVALFSASSLLCGLAPTLWMLVLCRVLQGAGGGGLQPSEQSILADTFLPAERGMAFAAYGMAIVLAPVIGPTLGGWITDNWNWRWIFFINVPVGVISLLLSSRVIEDPPWLEAERSKSSKGGIDYVGLGLVAIGLGCLQVVLDKGQREDWFASRFITSFTAASVAGLVAFALWEWRQKNPVVDLRLFRNRTFAMSNLMMFTLGLALYGSIVLLPQFVQQLMGYSATQAGLVLSPGGLAVMALMPLVGVLIVRVDARWLIAFGFIAMSLALFETLNLNPQVDFSTVMTYRIYQSIGLGFLFIPITTVAYVGVPQEDNNTVSGMVNLARNIGASVGVSMVETMLARRTQFHQDRLITHLTNYDSGLHAAARGLGATLLHHGLGRAESMNQAYARLYGAMLGQASTLAYLDAFWVMGVACAVMVPLVFLMAKNDPRTASMAVH